MTALQFLLEDIILILVSLGSGILIGIMYWEKRSIPISWLKKYAATNINTKVYADNEPYEAVSILGNACYTVLVNWYNESYEYHEPYESEDENDDYGK